MPHDSDNYLWRSFLAEKVASLSRQLFSEKSSIIDVWQGPKYASAIVQNSSSIQVTLRKRNSYVFKIIFIEASEASVNTHCVKSVQMQSYFWFLFSCIPTEYRKIRTRNNSIFGHFPCSACHIQYLTSVTSNRSICRTSVTGIYLIFYLSSVKYDR